MDLISLLVGSMSVCNHVFLFLRKEKCLSRFAEGLGFNFLSLSLGIFYVFQVGIF